MTPTDTRPPSGTAVELGRYVTDLREQRILLGRQIDSVVHIYDAPLGTGLGRTYFVERGFETRAELAMLVRDYLRQAERLGCCPMSRRAARLLIEAPRKAVG
ncbi:MAG TPA: hypothetical protein VN458_07005 [Solirubrobacterales bacterium]|nr:hypothetical protein [Solirubrobacterales bacterium]